MCAAKKSKSDDGSIAENRRARFEYSIGETFECGIVLVGSEVKSLRMKAVSFGDAYAQIERDELVLRGLKIDRYGHTSVDIVEPARSRKLLVSKKEIEKLKKLTTERGYTLVPLKLYFKGAWAKVLIGVGKGKSHEDKRDTIKKREADRDVARVLRRG
jgi:SsrA-binding protein